jgi:hypothetical protein
MKRPVLLMDIDGVLNPYAASTCPTGYSEYQLFPDDPEPHRLCVQHGAWLAELSNTFDIAWASAWGCMAHELLGPILGIERFPFVPMPPIPFPPAEKVPVIDSYVGARPAAWLDDLIGDEGHAWATSRTHPTLLLAVDPALGWTRNEVEQLLTWAHSLRSR